MQNKDKKQLQRQKRNTSPCHKERIDFMFCQREYGFNDRTFQLNQYQRCIQRNTQDFGFWAKVKSAFI